MDWNKLLTTRRVRELVGGNTSHRPSTDPRSEFERDYGRVVFSTPVRRLQDKTQVFPLEPDDAVRTRLTHSLEVSTVSRSVAFGVGEWLSDKHGWNVQESRYVELICATAALLHDIGNPPFGHFGERAIQDWAHKTITDSNDIGVALGGTKSQLAQDFLKFEGNAQTIRLVSRLQILADRHGLNLTAATLSTALKYTTPSHQTGSHHEAAKPGYFASEEQIIEAVRAETGTGLSRHPLTYIVEASDDIVYSVVDVEDGIKKKLLRWDELREMLEAGCPKSEPLASALSFAEQIVKDHSFPTGGRDEAYAQAFRTAVISEGVAAAIGVFKARYDEIISGTYHSELLFDELSGAASLFNELKNIGRKRVYVSDETLKLELMGHAVINDLLEVFWRGAQGAKAGRKPKDYGGKAYSLMSKNYREAFEAAVAANERFPREYFELQLVTDYVSGMTDSYAAALHQSLMNAR